MLVKEKKIQIQEKDFSNDNLTFEEFSELKNIEEDNNNYSWKEMKKLLSLKRKIDVK